jgi:hypothetical protein
MITIAEKSTGKIKLLGYRRHPRGSVSNMSKGHRYSLGTPGLQLSDDTSRGVLLNYINPFINLKLLELISGPRLCKIILEKVECSSKQIDDDLITHSSKRAKSCCFINAHYRRGQRGASRRHCSPLLHQASKKSSGIITVG